MKKMQIGGDGNTNETEEGGDHKAALRQKKLKPKTLKWKSSSKDAMNSKVEAGASGGMSDETVLCSLTTASIKSLISRKTVRTLGKVAQQCDAIDPPVPRRLRSVTNKRARHVKKRRHLSAISAQISFVDQRTKFNETSLLTEEEEVAEALLLLSQVPSTDCMSDKVIADRTNINASSTSYSGVTTKEGDKITRVPNAADELSACIVGRTDNVPHVNQVPCATNQSNNIYPPLLENSQIKDLSSGVIANLSSPCKDSSNNSARKQLKVQLGNSGNDPAQKPEAWMVNSNKSDNSVHENEKTKNEGTQEIMHQVQTPLPCTPDGYLIKPSSSKLVVQANTVPEPAFGNVNKVPPVHNVVPTKAWKRSSTHVYVSHLIQTHLNKEKASSSHYCQVKPEERSSSHIHTSRSPTGSTTLHKSNARGEETCYYAVISDDVRLPVQPSTGVCNMSAAGRQKMVMSGNFLNTPNSTALLGAQHVQYLHPPMTPRGPMPYPFPLHRAHPAPAATLHQMQQYMRNPGHQGYAPRPGLTASSSAMVKLQQLMPSHHQQQQQEAWRFHVGQYQQPRPDAAAAAAAWHSMAAASLRPMMSTLPATPAMPPRMELLCAPYQGGGSSRQLPQQLRLI